MCRTNRTVTTISADRGQVGIGTLIVFIAMVLVAAIAAGVLINTAGFLQSQSEETGEQSSRQVTDRVEVISETGTVSSAKIADVELTLKKAPGADDIDVSEATVRWIGPAGSSNVHSENEAWNLDAVSGSTTVLSDDTDVFKFTLDLGELPIQNELDPGEAATLEFTTAAGATTSVAIRAPPSLSGENAVDL
jgi:flagellin-like protein